MKGTKRGMGTIKLVISWSDVSRLIYRDDNIIFTEIHERY